MKAIFERFLIELVNDVPLYVYETLIFVAGICIAIFFVAFKWNKALKFSLRLFLGEYLFLTYCNTVFFRPRINDIWHNFTPFWSYKTYFSGEDSSLLPEIIMNIVGFIPLGFLIGASFQKLKWWQAILTGCLVSFSIESIQYFFKLGIAEFDDVFNNTLGVAIGYSLYALTQFLRNKISINKSPFAR